MSFLEELQGRLADRKAIVDAQLEERDKNNVPLEKKNIPPPPPPRNTPTLTPVNTPKSKEFSLDDILSQLEQFTNSLV